LLRVSNSMNEQNVANTLWACAKMGLDLGEAQEPLMCALLRVSNSMNAQNVANTLWALSRLNLQPGTAHESLLRRVPTVASSFNAMELRQMRASFDWLQEEGYSGECMEIALQSVGAGR
jgi:hypothetical protein